MGNKLITVYPPGGGEPVHPLPHNLDYYLENGWTQEPKSKSEKPSGKTSGKTTGKTK